MISYGHSDQNVSEHQGVRFRCSSFTGPSMLIVSLVKKNNDTVLLTDRKRLRHSVDLGDVHFINEPLSTTFDVTAYTAPYQVTFTFLGRTGNITQPPAVDDSQIQLAGDCQAKTGGAIYLFTCTVTVTNVTSKTAAGVYQVNVTNSQGDGQFHLKVLYKGKT
ncbi:hypothetical protein ACOMHN_058722 [Nucella lapillus]